MVQSKLYVLNERIGAGWDKWLMSVVSMNGIRSTEAGSGLPVSC